MWPFKSHTNENESDPLPYYSQCMVCNKKYDYCPLNYEYTCSVECHKMNAERMLKIKQESIRCEMELKDALLQQARNNRIQEMKEAIILAHKEIKSSPEEATPHKD